VTTGKGVEDFFFKHSPLETLEGLPCKGGVSFSTYIGIDFI